MTLIMMDWMNVIGLTITTNNSLTVSVSHFLKTGELTVVQSLECALLFVFFLRGFKLVCYIYGSLEWFIRFGLVFLECFIGFELVFLECFFTFNLVFKGLHRV